MNNPWLTSEEERQLDGYEKDLEKLSLRRLRLQLALLRLRSRTRIGWSYFNWCQSTCLNWEIARRLCSTN